MNRAYKMEPWALGADLNFLSVIFFFTLPLFLLPPSTSRRIRSVFFSFPPLPPSLSLPSFFSAITLADCNL